MLFLCILFAYLNLRTCRVILGHGAIFTDHDITATAEPIKRLRAAYVHGNGTSSKARLLLTLNRMEQT